VCGHTRKRHGPRAPSGVVNPFSQGDRLPGLCLTTGQGGDLEDKEGLSVPNGQSLPALKHRALLAVLGTVGFLVFAPVVLQSTAVPASTPAQAPVSSSRSSEDLLVIEYKRQIMELRGNVEDPQNGGGSWEEGQRGIRLANQILAVPDEHLHPTRAVMQHEYAALALLIVANTFIQPAQSEERRENRIRYASRAIEECGRALDKMKKITEAYEAGSAAGSADAKPMYDWMTRESGDLYRTQFLKALAMAVIAKENGGYQAQDVQEALSQIPQAFLIDNRLDKEPYLVDVLGKQRAPAASDTWKNFWISFAANGAWWLALSFLAGIIAWVRRQGSKESARRYLPLLNSLLGLIAGIASLAVMALILPQRPLVSILTSLGVLAASLIWLLWPGRL
jgi:hypothetical protein